MNYFAVIRRFPMLTADEEHTLAAHWRERGNEVAAHRLLTSHLRLVAKIAIGYRRYGPPISDLISEGNIGLLQAIKRYDPDKRVGSRHTPPGGSRQQSKITSCARGRL